MSTGENGRATILVVDDTPTNLELLTGILENEFDVLIASSGVQALELLARGARPDLMLLNVRMPVVDGYQLCSAVKANPVTRGIPVIFVTANDDPESEIAALEAGGADFVHRPINRHVLRARIRIQLEVAAYRMRLEEMVRERTLELAVARDAAESANRTKSVFLANVSHELRTPLHGMLSFMSLASRRAQDEKSRLWLEKATGAGKRLLTLVENLLDMTRIEAEELKLEIGDFDLDLLLADLDANVRAKAAAKGLTFRVERDASLPRFFRGDARRLAQVLEQLLENAVKFCDHGSIAMSARHLRQEAGSVVVRFTVSDDGGHIPAGVEREMFDLFRQGEETASRKHVGTGLGLALCRRLVALMGGEMSFARTEDRNQFLVTLSLMPGDAGRARHAGDAEFAVSDHVVAFVRRLGAMLAGGDLAAISLWVENEEYLRLMLGADMPEFAAAMDECDFQRALACLDRVLDSAPATGPEP